MKNKSKKQRIEELKRWLSEYDKKGSSVKGKKILEELRKLNVLQMVDL